MAICDATERCSSGVASACREDTSSSAFSISLSIRSSAFTPRPLRPETSTYGRLLIFVGKRNAQLGAAARRERHHFVGEVNRLVGLIVETQARAGRRPRRPASKTGARRSRCRRAWHGRKAGWDSGPRAGPWSPKGPGHPAYVSEGPVIRNPCRAGRISKAGRRCLCRRK